MYKNQKIYATRKIPLIISARSRKREQKTIHPQRSTYPPPSTYLSILTTVPSFFPHPSDSYPFPRNSFLLLLLPSFSSYRESGGPISLSLSFSTIDPRLLRGGNRFHRSRGRYARDRRRRFRSCRCTVDTYLPIPSPGQRVIAGFAAPCLVVKGSPGQRDMNNTTLICLRESRPQAPRVNSTACE